VWDVVLVFVDSQSFQLVEEVVVVDHPAIVAILPSLAVGSPLFVSISCCFLSLLRRLERSQHLNLGLNWSWDWN